MNIQPCDAGKVFCTHDNVKRTSTSSTICKVMKLGSTISHRATDSLARWLRCCAGRQNTQSQNSLHAFCTELLVHSHFLPLYWRHVQMYVNVFFLLAISLDLRTRYRRALITKSWSSTTRSVFRSSSRITYPLRNVHFIRKQQSCARLIMCALLTMMFVMLKLNADRSRIYKRTWCSVYVKVWVIQHSYR